VTEINNFLLFTTPGVEEQELKLACNLKRHHSDTDCFFRKNLNPFFLKIYFRACMSWEQERTGGGAKGEGESPADSTLSMDLHVGLNCTTLRSGPEPKSKVGCLAD